MSNVIDSIKVSGTVYTLSAQTEGGGVPESAFTAYTASTNERISQDEEVTAAGLNALNDKITPTVELTQAQYDALVTAGTVSADTYYIITDAQAGDLTNYYTKSETNTLLGGKQNTLSAGTGINISGNVISATGKAIEAGRGITITTGETADTVSFNLPISAGTGTGSLIIGDNGDGSYASYASGDGAVVFPSRQYYGHNYANGNSSFAHGSGCSAGTCCHAEGNNTKCVNGNSSHSEGQSTEARGVNSHSEGVYTLAGKTYEIDGCHAEGYHTSAMTNYSHAEGYYTKTTNVSEHASGRYNVSNKASTTFGDSGNTLFSVGNGTADNARHNAFEIRQNGDIYLTKDGQDIKLQDQLGGGGTVDQTIISGSTNAVAGGAVYNKIDEVEQVTAAGLNALNDNLGGLKFVKLTQAEYNALATKDSSTLYIIVN